MLDGFVPWPKEFVEKYKQKGCWQGVTLGEVFDNFVSRYSDRLALVGDNTRVTYKELGQKVDRLAYGMVELGFKTGDRIVVQLPNILELVYLYFACQKIGVIPIMSLAAHRWAEISYFAELAEARGYAAPARLGKFDYQAMARELRQKVSSVQFILIAGQTDQADMISINDTITKEINLEKSRTVIASHRPDPMEPAVMQLSGGTTGIPKLIPHPHNDYYHKSRHCVEVTNLDQNTVLLVVIPLAHDFPLADPGLTGTLMSGGRVVLSNSVQSEDIFRLIEQEGVTVMPCSPTFLYRWLDAPERKQHNLSSLKCLWVGASKPEADVLKKIMKEFSCDIQQVYGMSEGVVCYMRTDDPLELKLTTQGRPICPEDEFKIIGDDGKVVPKGEVGEFCARGPSIIRGYYKAPERNKEAFTSDGFYRSGDLVKLHESGNLIIVGRTKDLINRGGEHISAEEVERHSVLHPKVVNAACVGMSDRVLGERTCIFVTVKKAETLTLDELNEFLLNERRIAKYKLPERLEILEDLPLSNIGKVEKKVLRETINRKLKEEGVI